MGTREGTAGEGGGDDRGGAGQGAGPGAGRRSRAARLEGDARRAELLRVGRRVFGEGAGGSADVAALAREAGISAGLLYHYFPGKRALFVAVVEDIVRELAAGTAPDPALPPRERLRDCLRRYLAIVTPNRGIYRAVLHGGLDRELLPIVERLRALTAGWVEAALGVPAGKAPAALRLALRGWLGFVDQAVLAWLDAPRALSRERLLDLLEAALAPAVAAARAAREGARRRRS